MSESQPPLEIVHNYLNAQAVYEMVIELHGKEDMERMETSVYSLDSVEAIDHTIKNGGINLLKVVGRVIGIMSYKKGIEYRPLEGGTSDIVYFPDDWEVGGMVVHRDHRGIGHARMLYDYIANDLGRRGVPHIYIVATGTYDGDRLGEVRKMSKPVQALCEHRGGVIVGYARFSWGPVYRVPLEGPPKIQGPLA